MNLYSKANHTPYSDALIREAQGLESLRLFVPHNLLRVVDVYGVDEKALNISAVNVTRPGKAHWQKLAEGLAVLHKHLQPFYGFEHDNYIGLNPQVNGRHPCWGGFFVENRLRYQIERIRNTALRTDFRRRLNRSANRLAEYLDEHCEHPSLLHGDLWQGNVLFDAHDVWLIDPAVYYGDREVDIAMTEMFGGFDPGFYRAYHQQFPLTLEYPQKKRIYNLYHYLNHLNLFGEGYLEGCEQGMRHLANI